jgi:hypothetical protein
MVMHLNLLYLNVWNYRYDKERKKEKFIEQFYYSFRLEMLLDFVNKIEKYANYHLIQRINIKYQYMKLMMVMIDIY